MKKLDSIQTKLINTNLDENGDLPCIRAFKVAAMIGVKPKEMAKITRKMDIKISNCQLGVFGKLKFSTQKDEKYNILKTNTEENKKVECEIAWNLAKEKGTSLEKIGSSIRNSKLKITHCQLGLFYDKEFENFDEIRN